MARAVSLNDSVPDTGGKCVVYVMSRDQRVRDNHALTAAQAEAKELNLPLVVAFSFYKKSSKRSAEQFQFMVKGLKQLEAELSKRNISFIKLLGDHRQTLPKLFAELKPAGVWCDFSPLRSPKHWQLELAAGASFPLRVVDTHNIIPLWIASDKQEFAAHTLRKKIHGIIAEYLHEPDQIKTQQLRLKSDPGVDWKTIELSVEYQKSGVKSSLPSGEAAAAAELEDFISERLSDYAVSRNDPGESEALSGLSPYLHFGQISSLRVALTVLERTKFAVADLWLVNHDSMPKSDGARPLIGSVDQFFEQLIVRKELADNFCHFNSAYDSYDGAPVWAKTSLNLHRNDPRETTYTADELKNARTHDPAWNAAQAEMTVGGKMHGYMRMYWAKKILEWSDSPETAINTAVSLNDFYSLDGCDPNGYAGIMWAITGVHDRPWAERPVFGKIRYMNMAGLKRKFNIEEYISRWATNSTKP